MFVKRPSCWLFVSYLLTTTIVFAKSGDRANFLSEGPGARAGALGQAFTAVADDLSAIYFNPAGLRKQRGSFYAEHTPVYDGGRYNFIGFHYPLSWASVGFGMLQFATGGIEKRRNVGDSAVDAEATQTAWFVPVAFSWRDMALGASLKKIDVDLAGSKGNALGLDAGALYSHDFDRFSFLANPTAGFGVSVRNLVEPSMNIISQPETYPREIHAGLSLSGDVFTRFDGKRNELIDDRVLMSFDVSQEREWSVGLQYTYHDLISLRGGFNHDVMFGMGFGSSDGPFAIDYSLIMTPLVPQHRFALSYFFTPAKPRSAVVPKLRQFKQIQSDARRYQESLLAEGRRLMRDRRYDKAADVFERAWVLDPQNKEVNTLRDRSQEALRLTQVQQYMQSARQALQDENVESLMQSVTAGIQQSPEDKELRSFISMAALTLKQRGPAVFGQFEQKRQKLMATTQENFQTAAASDDIRAARHSVAMAQALDLFSDTTRKLVVNLRSLENKLFSRYMDEANAALAHGEPLEVNHFYFMAAQIFPENNDLRRQRASFHAAYMRKANYKDYDLLFQEQLFKAAALHFVHDEAEQCARDLNDLMRKNPIHEEGALLQAFLTDRKIMREATND